jgi:hypothetical protein
MFCRLYSCISTMKKDILYNKINSTTMKNFMLIIFSVVLMVGTTQAASNFHPKKHHYKNKSHSKFHVPHHRFVDRTYQN